MVNLKMAIISEFMGVYLCMSSTLLASEVNFPNFEKSVWQ